VYPADANLIVSLLDIHPRDDGVIDEPFEIFEAGTGHGALTLHLARAIHGLNPASPPLPPTSSSDKFSKDELGLENQNSSPSDQVKPPNGESLKDEPNLRNGDVHNHDQDPQSLNKLTTGSEHISAEEVRFEAYLPTRRAVIHTLDISPAFSKYAQSIVRKFRRGVYYHNIDFHVGTIPEYLSSRLTSTLEPFLEHTILDLPNPQEHLETVGQALKSNGSLIVFCPSITQIADCVKVIQEKRLPFHLESVLELGAGAGVGGREWDVRLVKPRTVLRAEAGATKAEEQSEAGSGLDSASNGKSPSNMSKESGWAMVCRPKVGSIVTGGGFLGLWRRMSVNSAPGTRRTQPVVAVEDEPESGPLGEPERGK
jgi:tRNA (adenine57-N1/adenine58-N1)-methyltransferase catalytic subunit